MSSKMGLPAGWVAPVERALSSAAEGLAHKSLVRAKKAAVDEEALPGTTRYVLDSRNFKDSRTLRLTAAGFVQCVIGFAAGDNPTVVVGSDSVVWDFIGSGGRTVDVNGEELQVGYFYPIDFEGNPMLDLQGLTQGAATWLLGPNKDGEFLGLGATGPAVGDLAHWTAEMAQAVAADSTVFLNELPGRVSRGIGEALEMLAAQLRDPGKWRLGRTKISFKLPEDSFLESKEEPMSVACPACGKTGGTFVCPRCHSGHLHCGEGCYRAVKESHSPRCALLPAEWPFLLKWCGFDLPNVLRDAGATVTRITDPDATLEKGHEFAVRRESGLHLSGLPVDCALFTELIMLMIRNEGEFPKVARFGTRALTKTFMFKDLQRIWPINGVEHTSGYYCPQKPSGGSASWIQNLSPGCGQWVFRSKEDGRMLGMGKRGAVRMTPEEWVKFLSRTVAEHSHFERWDAVGRRAMRLFALAMTDPSIWKFHET
jgi:hypothetical protein